MANEKELSLILSVNSEIASEVSKIKKQMDDLKKSMGDTSKLMSGNLGKNEDELKKVNKSLNETINQMNVFKKTAEQMSNSLSFFKNFAIIGTGVIAGFKAMTSAAGLFKSALSSIVGLFNDVWGEFRESINVTQRVKDMGEAFHTTTNDMMILTTVAEQENQSLDMLQRTMKILNDRIGGAAAGNKRDLKFFQELRIDIYKTTNGVKELKDEIEILFDIAKNSREMSDNSSYNKFLNDLLGRSGFKTEPIFKRFAAQDLSEFRKEFEALGIRAIPTAEESIKQFTNRVILLRKQKEAIFSNVGGALMPGLNLAIDTFQRTVGNIFNSIFDDKKLVELQAKFFKFTNELFDSMEKNAPGFIDTITNAVTTTTGFIINIIELAKNLYNEVILPIGAGIIKFFYSIGLLDEQFIKNMGNGNKILEDSFLKTTKNIVGYFKTMFDLIVGGILTVVDYIERQLKTVEYFINKAGFAGQNTDYKDRVSLLREKGLKEGLTIQDMLTRKEFQRTPEEEKAMKDYFHKKINDYDKNFKNYRKIIQERTGTEIFDSMAATNKANDESLNQFKFQFDFTSIKKDVEEQMKKINDSLKSGASKFSSARIQELVKQGYAYYDEADNLIMLEGKELQNKIEENYSLSGKRKGRQAPSIDDQLTQQAELMKALKREMEVINLEQTVIIANEEKMNQTLEERLKLQLSASKIGKMDYINEKDLNDQKLYNERMSALNKELQASKRYLTEISKIEKLNIKKEKLDNLPKDKLITFKDLLPEGTELSSITPEGQTGLQKFIEAWNKLVYEMQREDLRMDNKATEVDKLLKERKDKLIALNAEIEGLRGNTYESEKLRIQEAYNKALKDQTFIEKSISEDGEKYNKNLKIKKELLLIQNDLNKATKDYADLTAKLSIEEERINILLKNGRLSEMDAMIALGEARRANIADIEKEIAKQKELIASMYNSQKEIPLDMQNKLKQLQNQLLDLQENLYPLKKKFDEIFENSFSKFFDDIVDGTKTVKEAFQDLGRSIQKEITNLVSKHLSKQLMDSLFGGDGNTPGGWLAGIFGEKQKNGFSGFGSNNSNNANNNSGGGFLDSILGIFGLGGSKNSSGDNKLMPDVQKVYVVNNQEISNGIGQQVNTGMSDAMGKSDGSSGGFFGSIKNWFSGFFDSMKSSFGGIFDSIKNMFSGLFGGGSGGGGGMGGMFSGLFGGGGMGGGGLFDGLFSGIGSLFGFASGGLVKAGVPAFVGETGKELFIPNQSGRIVNAAQTDYMMRNGSAQNQSIVINIQASDVNSFRSSEGNIAAQIQRALSKGNRNL